MSLVRKFFHESLLGILELSADALGIFFVFFIICIIYTYFQMRFLTHKLSVMLHGHMEKPQMRGREREGARA